MLKIQLYIYPKLLFKFHFKFASEKVKPTVIFFEEEFNYLQEEEYLYRLVFIKYIYMGKPIANRNISEPAG